MKYNNNYCVHLQEMSLLILTCFPTNLTQFLSAEGLDSIVVQLLEGKYLNANISLLFFVSCRYNTNKNHLEKVTRRSFRSSYNRPLKIYVSYHYSRNVHLYNNPSYSRILIGSCL